jgi:hypothetical protein
MARWSNAAWDDNRAFDSKREKRRKQLMHIIHKCPGKEREKAIKEFKRDYDPSIKFYDEENSPNSKQICIG